MPTGNTNQGIGLAWGWMTLTQAIPSMRRPRIRTIIYKDAIVLLSDGLNTQNRWYSNAAQIDARQKILCDNAKAAGITIYTVQVNTGGDPTSAVLQYCAQGTDKLLSGHLGLADRCPCSTRSAPSSPSCASRNKREPDRDATKKPGRSGRAFSFRSTCEDYCARPG